MRLSLILLAVLTLVSGARASDAVPGSRPTTTHVVLSERLSPHSKLFGQQIIKFSYNPRPDIQQQFLRKNLLGVKDAIGGHVEILDTYLKDPQFKPTETERAKQLVEWMGVFEKEKTFSDSVQRFDKLYVRLRQAASVRANKSEVEAQLTLLERDVLEFAKAEPKLPWSLFIVGLTRQLSDVIGRKSTIEKDKEYYFNQASLAAVDDAQFHFVLGQLYLEYFDRSDTSTFLKLVATEFEKCLLIDSSHNNKELWSSITAIYVDIHEDYQKKDLPEPFWFEELVYKRIIKLDPTNASAHNNLSFLYSQNGVNLKDALKEAQIANQLSPNNPYLMDSLGWAFYKNKQLTQAMEVLKKAAALKSDIADVHFHLATVYFDQDDFTNASKEFKETIRLDPENAFAKNNLGYLYAEKGLSLDDALKLVEDALSKYPDNAAFIDTKGWIYFKQKKYDLAVEHLKKAIELMPETSDLHQHLGTVYLTLQKYQDAAAHFEKALTYDSGNSQIAKDLSYTYALHGLASSLERFQKISGVDRNKENFKIFHDLMAAVHQNKGDYLSAQKVLEEYRTLQSKDEPAVDESGDPGAEEETRPGAPEASPEPVPSPAATPSPAAAATPAPTSGAAHVAALLPPDTDMFVALEKGFIARFVDFAIEKARESGQRVMIPSGAVISGAIERIALGVSLRGLKAAGRSCGLALLQLSLGASTTFKGQLMLLGEQPRTIPGPMGVRIDVTSSRYKNQVLYQLQLPQGQLHVMLLDSTVVVACQKSDLVAAVDRQADATTSLEALPAFKKLANPLLEGNDVVMFAHPAGPIPASEVQLPAVVTKVLSKTEAIASGWKFGTDDSVAEQTSVLPTAPDALAELKAAFDEAARGLDSDLKAQTGNKAGVQADYQSADGMLRGTAKMTGAQSVAQLLYQLLRKQMGGELPGLR